MRRIVALAATLGLAAAAAAQDEAAPFTGFYAGAGAGSTEPTTYDGSGYWYDGDFRSGDSATSVQAFVGYRLLPFLAFELAYLDASGMGYDESLVYLPELQDVYNTDVEIDVRAGELSLVVVLPFLRIWEVYGRLGLAYWDAEADQRLVPSFGGATVERTVDDSGAGFLFGIGGGVTLPRNLHLRLEYQSFDVDEDLLAADVEDNASIDTLLLDVQYRFGRR